MLVGDRVVIRVAQPPELFLTADEGCVEAAGIGRCVGKNLVEPPRVADGFGSYRIAHEAIGLVGEKHLARRRTSLEL